MKLNGFNKFREKTPIFKGPRIIIVPLYALIIIYATFYFFHLFYDMPQELSDQKIPFIILVFVPLIGFIIIESLGFFLLSQMWIWRDFLKRKYGALAYQKIFLLGFAGIIIVLSLAFNVFYPIQNSSADFWQISNYSYLVKPLNQFFNGKYQDFIRWNQVILGLFLLILGIALSIRSIITFGLDYTTAVYIYFPEESEIKDNEIYSVLRHPMYSGIIIVAIGGFVYTLSIYSLLLIVLYIIGFYIHVHYVEEPELLSRFGESYDSYRKNVPPFFLNPLKFPQIVKFIIKG